LEIVGNQLTGGGIIVDDQNAIGSPKLTTTSSDRVWRLVLAGW
jgi:hypothetical protein